MVFTTHLFSKPYRPILNRDYVDKYCYGIHAISFLKTLSTNPFFWSNLLAYISSDCIDLLSFYCKRVNFHLGTNFRGNRQTDKFDVPRKQI